MFSSALAIALLFSQTAADQAAPKPAATAEAQDPRDRMICRKVAPIGSLIPKKTCRTAREWSALSEATRRELQQGSNSGGSNSN